METTAQLKCYACKQSLPVDAFHLDRSQHRGRSSKCKACRRTYKSAWQKANRATINEVTRRWERRRGVDRLSTEHRAAIRAITAKGKAPSLSTYCARIRSCKWCGAAYQVTRAQHRGHQVCATAAAKASRRRAKQTDKAREGRREYMRRTKAWKKQDAKYGIDPAYTLKVRMRVAVRRGLKPGKMGRATFKLLGYTPEQLRQRLECTMPDGCTWADFLAGRLHIDHITPVASFTFTTPDDTDFKRCWALDNLQLLTATANIRKGSMVA